MGEFFKPWRRKTGCVTILMALVFMGGWVRSHSRSVTIDCVTSKNTLDIWISKSNSLIWQRIHFDTESAGFDVATKKFPYFTWHSLAASNRGQVDESDIDWKWRFCGLGITEDTSLTIPMMGQDVDATVTSFYIPYWSIVIPLTVLSAYLLLSKPRKTKPIAPTQPEPSIHA